MPALATSTSRSFRQDDGSVVQRIYAAPVNVRGADGTWRHVDTALKTSGGALAGTRTTVPVRVSKRLKGGAIVVGRSGDSASLSPIGLDGVAAPKESEATFRGAATGLDVQHAVLSNGAKQTYVLRGENAPKQIDLVLRAPSGFTVRSLRGGGAQVLNAKGRVRYELSPSFGWAGTDESKPRRVTSTVRRVAGGWRVRIDTSAAWIRRALRTQTVTVDPTFTAKTATQDAILAQSQPTNAGLASSLGRLQVSNGNRSLLQFDISSVPENSRVISATVALRGVPLGTADDTVSRSVTLHEATADWVGGQASWNARKTGVNWATAGGSYNATAAATVTNARSSGGWFYWTPTALVQQWVSRTSTNNGFLVFGQPVGSSDVSTAFAGRSATGANAAFVPYMQVRYAPPAGQRRDDTYLSEDLNDRMKMGVGVASGNLLLSSNDISINGVGTPLSLVRTYNTGLVGSQTGSFGTAGTSSLSGDVRVADLAGGDAGVYLGDGSFYRFPKGNGNGYTAAKRLEADLVKNTDGTWTLTYRRSRSKWGFNAAGRLATLTDKNNNVITLGYTSAGVLSTITDTQGRQLPVTVNSGGQITKISDPTGREWSYTYAGTGGNRLATFTDPEGGVTRYTYDGSNRVRKLETPGGRITLIAYDGDSRVASYTRVTDPGEESGPTTTLTYDQDSPRCAVETGDPNRTTVVTDPRGKETTYCVNPQLQVVTAVDPDGHEQKTTYTPDGQVEKFTDGTGTGSAITTNTYASSTANLTASEGAEKETTTFAQNAATTLEKYQPASSTDPDQKTEYYTYDANGNTTTVKDGQTGNYEQQTLTYNGDGTLATSTDRLNHQTTYTYWQASDGGTRKGLLKSFAPPSPRNPTTLDYDTLGRVTSATDGNGKATTYTYDKLDRVKTSTTEGNAGTLGSSTNAVVGYVYDADGNETTRSDTFAGDNGGTYGTGYDALNRTTQETLPGNRSINYTYDESSNLKSITDPSGTVGYGYDSENQNCYVAPGDSGGGACVNPPSGATTMQYDELGNRTKITGPNGVATTIGSDLSGKTKSIVSKKGSTTLASRSYLYKTYAGGKNGELVDYVSGGRAYRYDYDSSGRLAGMAYQGTGSGPSTRVYEYDLAGNRTSTSINFLAFGANSTTERAADRTYTYNDANQLTSMIGPGINQTFSYDGAGNDQRFSYNTRNQTSAVGGQNLTYAGPNQAELTGDNTQTVESNLLGISRRLSSSGAATQFLRASDGTLLARIAPGNVASSYVLDYQGSVIAIADSAGARTKKDDYDPDGNLVAGSDPIDDFGYTSSYRQSGTKTIYKNGLRWYDPETARWTQTDPLDQPNDLRNSNSYEYGAGDPINNRDPLGASANYNNYTTCPSYGKKKSKCGRSKPGRRLKKSQLIDAATGVAAGVTGLAVCATPGVNLVTCGPAAVGYGVVLGDRISGYYKNKGE